MAITKALISCAHLNCAFDFACAFCFFSHDAAHFFQSKSERSKLASLWSDSDDSDDSVICLDPVPKSCSSVKKTGVPVVQVSSTKV